MKKTFIKILSVLLVAMSLTSCLRKDNYFSYDQSSPSRKQVVKIANGGDLVTIARDVAPTIDTIQVIDLRREPNNAAELNQPLTVKLVKNPAIISDYNTANGTSFVELPANAYTILGDLNNITFQPGEDIKHIKIRLNKSALDLSQQYALGFSIADASGAVINTSLKNGIYSIGIKNQWHGTYHASGVFHHPIAGDRPIDEDKDLLTAGARSVSAPLGDLGAAGYYMILTINIDNTVTITPSGVTPNIDQHWGPNYYDPATKTFHLHYSYNTAAPRIIEETLTLL